MRLVPVVLASAALNGTVSTEEPYHLGAHLILSSGPHGGGLGAGNVAGQLPVADTGKQDLLPPASLSSFPGRPPARSTEPLEQL